MKTNYKKIHQFILIFSALLFSLKSYSQTLLSVEKQFPVSAQEECISSQRHKFLMENDLEYRAKREADEAYLLEYAKNPSTEKAVKIIPIVVHVMHTGQAISTIAAPTVNISDAQIQSAIDYMTKAYRAQTPYSGGVDTQIEFCLAKRDPSGNPSTGIVRYNASGISGYSSLGCNTDSGLGTVNELAIKAASQWDNTKYYNVWIVTEIDNNGGGAGTQGFAYFAGASAAYDGAIMLYNAFGYDLNGTIGYNLKSYTNLNITPTHEIGHALNLYHTFEGDGTGSTCPTDAVCGTSGDCCPDTPRHKRSNSDCVVGTNSCTGGSSTLHIHNFMDYSSDDCQTQFSSDQYTIRMSPSLASGGSRYSLTQSNGCNSVFANDASISAVIAPNGSYCKTTFSPIVTLSNSGSSTLTSVTITYNIDGTGSQVYNWTGSLASNTTVNVTLASMTTTSGAHTFNAATSLPNGVADEYTANDAIAAVAFNISVSAIPYTENFEGTFVPTGWIKTSADTPDASVWGVDGFKQWEKRSTSGNGTSTSSAALNCFNYNNGAPGVDELISPAVDLNGTTVPELKFNVAHAYYGTSNQERLRVLVSTDCGVTFTEIYNKTYTALATVGQSSVAFSPTTAAHWRLETVSLTPYIGNSVVLKFEGTSGYGNNLYLDDINVSEPCVAPTISLQPSNVSSCSGANISIITTATGAATLTYQWQVSTNGGGIFTNITDGGVYSTATTSSLMITGLTSGMSTYLYKCIVTNGCGTVTTNTSTLTVNSASAPTISVALTTGTNPTCAGDALTFSATPTNGGTTPSYQWQVDGVNVGTNSAIFSSSSITNGQIVTCILTSNDPCASPLVATSTGTTITTSSSVAPTVSISITSGSNPSTSGSSITFTATPTTGGTTPSYQWQVNGVNAGTNASSFVTTSLTNGQLVTCILTSNSPCASPLTANSNTITMVVNASNPPPTGSSPQTLCAPATIANFVVTGTLIQWYANSTGGTALSSSTALTNGTTYYASQTIGGVESTSRLAVTAVITTVSAPAGSTTQSFCSASTVSNLSATGTTVQWYATLTGGTALSNSTVLATGATYYASQTVSGCTSDRLAVIVTIVNTLAPTGSANQIVCPSSTVANLVAVGTGIQWYTTPSGGTALPTSTSLVSGTTYYAAQTVSGCVSSSRLLVSVVIGSAPAAPSGASAQHFCGSATVADLVASGTSIQWYASPTMGSVLSPTFPLSNGSNYYATQSNGSCESLTRFLVAVSIDFAPSVSMAALPIVCSNASPLTLTQGSPIGGTYSGVGVSGGAFNPSALALGSYTITYSYTNVSLCSGTATGIILVDDCTGLVDILDTKYLIFPNPANQFVLISSNNEPIKSVKLFDNIGRLILSQEITLFEKEVQINLSNYSEGIYIIQISSESKSVNSKISIKR